MNKSTLYWIYQAHGRFYQCFFGDQLEHNIQLSNVFAYYDNLESDVWTIRLFFKGDYSPRIKEGIKAKTPEEAQKLAVERVKEYIANNLKYWQYMSETINTYKHISVAPQTDHYKFGRNYDEKEQD